MSSFKRLVMNVTDIECSENKVFGWLTWFVGGTKDRSGMLIRSKVRVLERKLALIMAVFI